MRNLPVRAGKGWSDAFSANAATGAAFAEVRPAFTDAEPSLEDVRLVAMLFGAMRFDAMSLAAKVFSLPRSSTTTRYALDSMLTDKFDPSLLSSTIRAA